MVILVKTFVRHYKNSVWKAKTKLDLQHQEYRTWYTLFGCTEEQSSMCLPTRPPLQLLCINSRTPFPLRHFSFDLSASLSVSIHLWNVLPLCSESPLRPLQSKNHFSALFSNLFDLPHPGPNDKPNSVPLPKPYSVHDPLSLSPSPKKFDCAWYIPDCHGC